MGWWVYIYVCVYIYISLHTTTIVDTLFLHRYIPTYYYILHIYISSCEDREFNNLIHIDLCFNLHTGIARTYWLL